MYILQSKRVFKIGSIGICSTVSIRDASPKSVYTPLAKITDYHLIWLKWVTRVGVYESSGDRKKRFWKYQQLRFLRVFE